MGFFNKEVELIIPPKKQNNKTTKLSLNGYDSIREKTDENNTPTGKQPVQETTKPKSKVSIGL